MVTDPILNNKPFSTIFFEVYNYLPSDDIGLGRDFTYHGNKGKRVSIK